MQKIAGGPTPAGTSMMRVGARSGTVNQSKRYHWQQPDGTEQAKTDFPIVPVAPDGYDDVANIKQQYASQADGASNWVVPFEQSDAAYLLRKRDAEEKAQYDIWLQQKYDLTDPAQNMMLQSIAPELYQRREEVIDANQDLVTRYAKIRLRGAKSQEDLYFEWLVETKRIDLPQGPIWDPEKWRAAQRGRTGDDAWQNQRYQAGFFSPLKWMSRDQTGETQDPNNYFNVQGTGNRFIPDNLVHYASGGDIYDARYPNVYSQAVANPANFQR